MRDNRHSVRSRTAVLRVGAAASVLLLFSACADRPYLSDGGWRAAVPGATDAAPDGTGAQVVTAADPVELAESDVSLVSLDGTGCSIARLASGQGDAAPTDAELRAAHDCQHGKSQSIYTGSGHVLAQQYGGWTRLTDTPFFSEALGERYGTVYANGRAMGTENPDNHYDRGFPVGATLAVPTFTVSESGAIEGGPLIFVEKMEPGFFALQGNWRYTILAQDGQVLAVTRGVNEDEVSVCADCTHSQADLFYASLLNGGAKPFAEGDGPAFPSVDTYGTTGGAGEESLGNGTVLDPNAPLQFEENAPVLDPNAPILDPNAPTTDG